jgi:hypothetical protein
MRRLLGKGRFVKPLGETRSDLLMEISQNQPVCPECGNPAGQQPFCGACGANLNRYRRLPTRAEWEQGLRADKASLGVPSWSEFFSLEKGWVRWLLGLPVSVGVWAFLISWGAGGWTPTVAGFIAGTAVVWYLDWKYGRESSPGAQSLRSVAQSQPKPSRTLANRFAGQSRTGPSTAFQVERAADDYGNDWVDLGAPRGWGQEPYLHALSQVAERSGVYRVRSADVSAAGWSFYFVDPDQDHVHRREPV